MKGIIAIAIGGSAGSILRWWIGLKLNDILPTLPLGTVTANLIGGYIIGFAIAFFSAAQGISQEWRLLIITGFCGGLTTFSTFSAEVVTLIQQDRLSWALGSIAVHLTGSLLMTALGIVSFTWIYGR